MQVQYTNGIKATYWTSQIACGKLNAFSIRIFGDKGSLEWNQEFLDYVKYTPLNQPTQILSRGQLFLEGKSTRMSQLPAGHTEGYLMGFYYFYRSFLNDLLGVVSEDGYRYPTIEDGRKGMQFIEAVLQSAQEDAKWVQIDSK